MWGHIERATVRMQMCRGPGCPVRVRTGAGWIVRDGAAGRATCGSTADHLALYSDVGLVTVYEEGGAASPPAAIDRKAAIVSVAAAALVLAARSLALAASAISISAVAIGRAKASRAWL